MVESHSWHYNIEDGEAVKFEYYFLMERQNSGRTSIVTQLTSIL